MYCEKARGWGGESCALSSVSTIAVLFKLFIWAYGLIDLLFKMAAAAINNKKSSALDFMIDPLSCRLPVRVAAAVGRASFRSALNVRDPRFGRDVPFGNLTYSNVNSMGHQWIRQYTLALSKELLGLVRSKFSSVPISEGDLTLNGSELISQGREDKDKLRTELKEMLDTLTYDKLIESDASQAENMQRILKTIPMPVGKGIVIG